MYNNLKISVVMATYNGERFIREQLDSVVQQTLLPDEILISDDGSGDNTLAICKEYAKKYPSICIISNESEHGPNGNFIQAFQKSIGDLIFPCDQDDVWKKNKIETMVSYFSDENIDIVAAQDEITDEHKNIVATSHWGFSLNHTMWKNNLAGHACAFRRHILNIYEFNKILSFDYMLCLYGSITNKSVSISDTLVLWRRHEDATTCGDLLVDGHAPKSKYGKFLYAIRQCNNGNQSSSFAEYMTAREDAAVRMGGANYTPISFAMQRDKIYMDL